MQRRIVNIDGQETEVILIDKEWMEQKYKEFQYLFNGYEMPQSIVLKPTARLTRTWGRAVLKCRGYTDGGTFHITSSQSRVIIPDNYIDDEGTSPVFIKKRATHGQPLYTIYISTSKLLPESAFESVMVHEMIHICCYHNGIWQGKHGHSGGFKMIADQVKKISNGKFAPERYVPKNDIETYGKIRNVLIDEARGFVVIVSFFGDVWADKEHETYGDIYSDTRLAFWFDTKEEANKFASKCEDDPRSVLNASDAARVAEVPSGVTMYEVNPDNAISPKTRSYALWIKKHCAKISDLANKSMVTRAIDKNTKMVCRSINVLRASGCIKDLMIDEDVYESYNEDEKLAFISEGIISNAVEKVKDFTIKTLNGLKRLLQSVYDSLFDGEFEYGDGWAAIS